MKLQYSYSIDCSNATKSGLVDYIFNKKPKYLLLDELDKLSRKDQTFLLNLMETGILSEAKYKKTKRIEIKTYVFATSNNIEKIIPSLQSRMPNLFLSANLTLTVPIGDSAIHSPLTFFMELLSPAAHFGRFSGFDANSYTSPAERLIEMLICLDL
jgi:hypothetical protein